MDLASDKTTSVYESSKILTENDDKRVISDCKWTVLRE
jgi:hypothetical protein